ncbi:MAG: YeeE/YedE thiosulfate transporter family protein, partial [Sneathiella sp.]
ALWMCWEAIRLIRSRFRSSFLKGILASRYKLSSAAFIIGGCNGVLFFIYGIWVHTKLLSETARHLILDAPVPDAFLWILFGSLLTGITISALHSRRFDLKWRPNNKWFLYFGGGILMGIGGSMIPGGNDVIWLNALPSLSLHSVPAILSILAGIAATLLGLRYFGLDIQHVDCHGDVCKVTDNS